MADNRAEYPCLKADCSQCAALCCVALAYDQSDLFGFDKSAGEPCRHLGADHKCSVHDNLGELGFSGCVQYDCLGAGQRVTMEVFAGKSWQDAEELTNPMMEAFRGMRRVHEALELLQAMAAFKLSDSQLQKKRALERQLLPSIAWTPEALLALERGSVFGELRLLIQELRTHIVVD